LAKFNCSNQRGFSLAETVVAVGIMTAALLTLAQLFAMAVAANTSAKNTTFATILAEQKLEQLRALAWGFDREGLPITDTSTDTSVDPETPNGGTGLSPSPNTALQQNTNGWVDWVDRDGKIVGNGQNPPAGAMYLRRWSVEPLPTNPNNTIIIQVLVSRIRDRGAADNGRVARLAEEARVMSIKTRKSQ
jgi:type II secretory pathway pseudopilin PulG